MKKLKIYLILLQIVFINQGIAQTNTEKNNFVTFDVAKAFPPLTRLNFGYYRTINDHLNLGINYGFSISNKDGRSKNRSLDYKLNEYILELQYILTPKSRTKKFLSIETHYINHKEILVNGRAFIDFDNTPRSEYSYSKIDYERTKLAFNLNFGLIIPLNKKRTYGLSPKIGVGYRIRNVKFSNPVDLKIYEKETNPGSMIYIPEYKIGTEIYESGGKNSSLNLSASLKLFYNF